MPGTDTQYGVLSAYALGDARSCTFLYTNLSIPDDSFVTLLQDNVTGCRAGQTLIKTCTPLEFCPNFEVSPATCLRERYAESGTDPAYGAPKGTAKPMGCYAVVRLPLACYALTMRCLRYRRRLSRISSYAMSRTGIAHDAIVLRARYAMSGTDIARFAVCVRALYAMSGTDKAYGATTRARTSAIFEDSVDDSQAGTGIAYAAMLI
eukprot:3280466-Rhodomonas_salina.2